MPLPPVVFEDESLVVFDKPSGLLVAPDRWDKKRENLMGLVHASPRFGPGVANVHRLDADKRALCVVIVVLFNPFATLSQATLQGFESIELSRGSYNYSGVAYPNVVNSSFGTIAGRRANHADVFQYLFWRSIGIVLVIFIIRTHGNGEYDRTSR